MTGPARLIIDLSAEGQVNISGPIGNRLLCYGLLEVAKDLVKDYSEKQAKSPIVQVGSADIRSINRS